MVGDALWDTEHVQGSFHGMRSFDPFSIEGMDERVRRRVWSRCKSNVAHVGGQQHSTTRVIATQLETPLNTRQPRTAHTLGLPHLPPPPVSSSRGVHSSLQHVPPADMRVATLQSRHASSLTEDVSCGRYNCQHVLSTPEPTHPSASTALFHSPSSHVARTSPLPSAGFHDRPSSGFAAASALVLSDSLGSSPPYLSSLLSPPLTSQHMFHPPKFCPQCGRRWPEKSNTCSNPECGMLLAQPCILSAPATHAGRGKPQLRAINWLLDIPE
jgi:hypothetical protein